MSFWVKPGAFEVVNFTSDELTQVSS